MKNKPVVSLFGSGIRAEKWDRLCDSLKSNEIDYEIIIAGSVQPICRLPGNFHFIYTKVKPSQCAEIAVRYSTGDFVLNIADDEIFSEGFIDNMVYEYENKCTESDMISCKFQRHGLAYDEQNYKYWPHVENSPKMPLNSMMLKKLWDKIGGIDRRFVALFWDLDVALRVLENGGKIIFSENAWCEEMFDPPGFIERLSNKVRLDRLFNKNKSLGLFQEYGKGIDRPFLATLWEQPHIKELDDHLCYCHKGNISHMKKRNHKVETFKDEYLLTRTQGPIGKW